MTPVEWLEAEFDRDPYPERLGCHPRKLLTFVPCEEIAAAARLMRPEHQPALAKASLLASTSATNPQVASEDPQVADRGWLSRLFDRWRRQP